MFGWILGVGYWILRFSLCASGEGGDALAGVGGRGGAGGEIAFEEFAVGVQGLGFFAELLEAGAAAEIGLDDGLAVGAVEDVDALVVGDGRAYSSCASMQAAMPRRASGLRRRGAARLARMAL